MRLIAALALAMLAACAVLLTAYAHVASDHVPYARRGIEPADVEHARRLCRQHGRHLAVCRPFDGSAASVDLVLSTLD